MFIRDIRNEVKRVMRDNGKEIYKVTLIPMLVVYLSQFLVPSNSSVAPIVSLLVSVVTIVIQVLVHNMTLSVYRGESFNFDKHVKEEIKDGELIKLAIVRTLFIILWSLLFLIPGYIKQLSYSFSPYILKDNRNLSAKDAITKSKRMTSGKKWTMFKLSLYYYGLPILGTLILITFLIVGASITQGMAMVFALILTWLISNALSIFLITYAFPRYELAIAIMYEESIK